MKECKNCNTEKPTNDFYAKKSYKDGLDKVCKTCRIAQICVREKENRKLYKTERPIIDIISKTCSDCQLNQNIVNFHKNVSRKDGYANLCKTCNNQRSEKYVTNNKEKEKLRRRKRYLKNRKKELLQSNEYVKRRKAVDPAYKMVRNIRDRHYKAVKAAGANKSFSSTKLLGCTATELKEYIEQKFTEGMSWGNHGEWHIDHIYPLANVDWDNKDQISKVCHYTNLQPLWAAENIAKGNR